MCTVEYYHVAYPDGFIEKKRRIVPCKRGTISSPCKNLQYDNDSYEERLATEEEIRARMEPYHHVMDPRPERSNGPEITPEGSKPRGILRKIFGSKDKAKPQTKPSEHDSSRTNETLRKSRSDGSKKSAADPRTVRRYPREVKVHSPDKEKEQSSSSPKSESKYHQRHPSPVRDPELDRARLREEERQRQRAKQEHMDKAAKELQEARARAEKLHHEEQRQEQRQQDPAQATGEGKKRRNGRPASYHAIPDEQLTDEKLRAQQRQYEQDWERIRNFDRLVAQRQEEEDRHTRQEPQGRHARGQAENQGRLARRRQEDGNRRRRQREAGIPRQPRHPPVIDDIRNYDSEDLDQQGSDFIESAIRTAEGQDAERRAPPASWSLPVRGRDGLIRRNTMDGSQGEERNGRRRKGHKRDGRSG